MNFDYKRTCLLYALQPRFLFLIDATVKRVDVFNEASHRFHGSVNFHFENHGEYPLHQQLHVIFHVAFFLLSNLEDFSHYQ